MKGRHLRSLAMYRAAAGGQPFVPGADPRRNQGGRPRSPRRLVREALGDDGETIVRFLVDVFQDGTASMADRIVAAGWLANLAFSAGVHPGRSHRAADNRQTPGPARRRSEWMGWLAAEKTGRLTVSAGAVNGRRNRQ